MTSGDHTLAAEPRGAHAKSRPGHLNFKRATRRWVHIRQHNLSFTPGDSRVWKHGVECGRLLLKHANTNPQHHLINSFGPACRGDSVYVIQCKLFDDCDMLLRLISLSVLHLPEEIASILLVIEHFDLLTCSSIASVTRPYVLKHSILALLPQSSYLMHALLGTAALHLSDSDAIA